MLDLLTKFSLSETIIFTILLCLAIKDLVSFIDWAVARLKQMFQKENKQEEVHKNLQEQIDMLKQDIENMRKVREELTNSLSFIKEKIGLLLDSDRDDIKSFITEKHHFFCYQQRWIDDHNLDCLEKRYSHYIDEDGNSFIKDLMSEIRALPKQPPQE